MDVHSVPNYLNHSSEYNQICPVVCANIYRKFRGEKAKAPSQAFRMNHIVSFLLISFFCKHDDVEVRSLDGSFVEIWKKNVLQR